MDEELTQGSPVEGERVTLQAAGRVLPGGRFEVDAITAGEGNGWQFSAEVLKESLPLWEGAECFVDHGGWWTGRSVRDLGGVFVNPRWSEEARAVRLDLRTMGPSAALVDALGREMLAEGAAGQPEAKPRVGFSADILFTAQRKNVQKILRVLSLDLVFNPARGGAFVRALNSVQESGGFSTMAENLNGDSPETVRSSTASPAAGGSLLGQLGADMQAMRDLLNVQEERQRLAAEAEAARELRVQMCSYLLDSGLGASKLPAAMQEHIRKQFTGRVFEPGELTQAIDDARGLVSKLTGPGTVVGPLGRVHSMFNTEDKLQAAVDDLLGAPRSQSAQGLEVERLSGIKELYMLLTGDRDLYGGFYPDRVQLATTATMTGLVKNALNKVIANQWAELGAAGYDWWKRVSSVEHFDTLNEITGILVGTVGLLPSIAEGGDYTELTIGDSPETASFTKYGGYIPLTLELIDRDETRKLRQYPRELAKAGLRRISALVAAVFTANAGAGPAMADTGNLFNATAVTTAGGHGNLLTTALAAASWETAKQTMYKQPLLISNEAGTVGTGPRQALKPRYLLVPAELELTAAKILYGAWDSAASLVGENLQKQRAGDVVVVPEWTDANDWAAAADPALSPGIVVGERFGLLPEIFVAGDELSPAVFTNDEHRIKVRHFVAVLVQDFRPLVKSNVT